MPSKKKDDKEITVVAELTVSSDDGVETIRTFDKAWHRLLRAPSPAVMTFRAWVRKS